MKYMGSKGRIAKDILPIILQNRKENQYYVEPFVGGCNIIDKVDGLRIGADFNRYLIAFWKGLQEGREILYPITKEKYDYARKVYNGQTVLYNPDSKPLDDYDIGMIGFMGSFNGRFFDGGYSGNSGTRDYIDEQIRNTKSQIEAIKGIEFYYCSYEQLEIPTDSIVYCDIPYQGTKQYHLSKKFDYERFWNWARVMSRRHELFVSEYNAPDDFECIWQKDIKTAMNQTKTLKATEKLFKWKQN